MDCLHIIQVLNDLLHENDLYDLENMIISEFYKLKKEMNPYKIEFKCNDGLKIYDKDNILIFLNKFITIDDKNRFIEKFITIYTKINSKKIKEHADFKSFSHETIKNDFPDDCWRLIYEFIGKDFIKLLKYKFFYDKCTTGTSGYIDINIHIRIKLIVKNNKTICYVYRDDQVHDYYRKLAIEKHKDHIKYNLNPDPECGKLICGCQYYIENIHSKFDKCIIPKINFNKIIRYDVWNPCKIEHRFVFRSSLWEYSDVYLDINGRYEERRKDETK